MPVTSQIAVTMPATAAQRAHSVLVCRRRGTGVPRVRVGGGVLLGGGRCDRARQVGEQRVQVAVGAGGVGGGDPLVVLLDGQPSLGQVLPQAGGDRLAVGVGGAEVRVGNGALLERGSRCRPPDRR